MVDGGWFLVCSMVDGDGTMVDDGRLTLDWWLVDSGTRWWMVDGYGG